MKSIHIMVLLKKKRVKKIKAQERNFKLCKTKVSEKTV